MAFIAGAYKLTFNTNVLGYTETGFNCSLRPSLIPVRTDQYGRSIVDYIFAGLEVGYVRAEIYHGSGAATPTFAMLYPWLSGGTIATGVGTMASAGTPLLKTLVLTPDIAGQTTYTFTANTICTNAIRNFSSTRPVAWTMEFATIITAATGVLFTTS